MSDSLPSTLRPPPSAFDYDALLLVSFGGPERPEEVMPFLEHVAAGKKIPGQRLLEVAGHYALLGGCSPINAENRALLAALLSELNARGPHLPVYWGNRYWHPLLVDTLRQMADDGVRRALAFVTSAFSSYPGCRQYLEAVAHARQEVSRDAPQVDKLRVFYNHPGFIEPMAERVAAALREIAAGQRDQARLIYTAHSIPAALARNCPYVEQLQEACALVSQRVGRAEWDLVYQSRSGPPEDSWLEPDIRAHLRSLGEGGAVHDVAVVPIGFVCECIEVAYDLDVEVRQLCEELGLRLVRAAVVGRHPRLVQMICELIRERIEEHPTRLVLGSRGPWPDACPSDCCPAK
jgi:ferrochelatase